MFSVHRIFDICIYIYNEKFMLICSFFRMRFSVPVAFQFLSSMNLMDYSVCLGIHDSERSELEKEKEGKEKEKVTSDGEGSGENGPDDEDDEDSAGSGVGGAGPTPPDSPQAYREELPLDGNSLNASRDIYATASVES